jgi:site-specific recombinase XerD
MVIVAFYNLSMDKLSKDQIQLNKANRMIDEHMPEFARRFFNDKKYTFKASSYYAYALDLNEFFDYLGTTSFTINSMKLSDLSKISPEVIEEYVEYVRSATVKGKPKVSSGYTLKRKLCVLSSFFDYYFQKGFIIYNPLLKVNRPITSPNPPPGSDMQDNLKLLEYVSKGNLPSDGMIRYQNKLRSRDTAILTLIIGIGMKSSECVDLNITDIDMEHNCLTIRSRRKPNKVYFSQYIAETLSVYLSERLEMITFYGHDDALFLSLQMKRLGVRSIEKLLKKYSSLLFGDENAIRARDMRNAFKKNTFTQAKNIFITSEITGNATTTLLRSYAPYLEYYETEKGKDFDPKKFYIKEAQNEVQ